MTTARKLGQDREASSGPTLAGRSSPSRPSISTPTGGGAIRSIGEKFSANPATGTGSFVIPLPTSPPRSNLLPELSLQYDSGSGNGPFGLGWSLPLPSITRKTEKGIPKYVDDDVFILSGAEDLVPELKPGPSGARKEIWDEPREVGGVQYRVRRYRPRTEGLFARIERWTRVDDDDVHWRTISKENVTTLYGALGVGSEVGSVDSRIQDPVAPHRTFSWLICKSFDDKGNAVEYAYVAEDSLGVDEQQAHEANRSPLVRSANRYIKRVRYANATSLLAANDAISPLGPDLSAMDWHFELLFDYGERHVIPAGQSAKGQIVDVAYEGERTWSVRPDAFSRYRSGFEVRTYRRCERVLLFHHFASELSKPNYLVRSLDLEYTDTELISYLSSATAYGYVHQDSETYLRKSLPPIEFDYSRSPLESLPIGKFPLRDFEPDSLKNVPAGIGRGQYQWLDLDGEGISGLLTEQGKGWYYKANLGCGELAEIRAVNHQPAIASLRGGRQQFLDLAGDGQLDLVQLEPAIGGFHERSDEGRWKEFRAFKRLPRLDWGDRRLRFTDLTGDGLADVLVAEADELTWFHSLGEEGFDLGGTLRLSQGEEQGPQLVFSDPEQAVLLADMSGDGLSDVVRVRKGEVCYWPNLGYGRFGPKVVMDNSPWLDSAGQFDARRLYLADTDGSGTTDLIYHGREGALVYLNRSGNSWTDLRLIESVSSEHQLSNLSTVDLLGKGTICLVWSSSLPTDSAHSMKYIDLMQGQKPHLLVGARNNLGAETRISYTSSTHFYLQDKADGKPWVTKLPFPVHVVTRVETIDRIGRNRFVTRYAYHHGHFDGVEREFRGFGMVERWDTERIEAIPAREAPELAADIVSDISCSAERDSGPSTVPPVLTRTWFHTGVFPDHERISTHFAGEYYASSDAGSLLPDTELPQQLTAEEEREACRALRGTMLRQEVYALDGMGVSDTLPYGHPYVVTEQNFGVKLLQPRAANPYAVFHTSPRESITYHYERNPTNPRVAHSLTLEIDDFGNVIQSVDAAYGRMQADAALAPGDQATQGRPRVTYSRNEYTAQVSAEDVYRTPLLSETRTYELTGYGNTRYSAGKFVDPDTLQALYDEEIPYQTMATAGRQRRLIEHVRTLYRRNDLSGPLDLGEMESRGLVFETYKLALTPAMVADAYLGGVNDAMLLNDGRYVHSEDDANWWVPSGKVFYSPVSDHTPAQELDYAKSHFFTQLRFRDPFHTSDISTEFVVRYDPYDLIPVETVDAIGNRTTAETVDYRVLQPVEVSDANRNRTRVAFDALGMVVGTAVMGKAGEGVGDSLEGFEADLPANIVSAHLASPTSNPHEILGKATTRLVYDPLSFNRTKNDANPQPAFAYSLARETHVSDSVVGQLTRVQHSFSFSDGFGREIQKKVLAESGPVPRRESPGGSIVVGPDGQPSMSDSDADPRWVGTGWTVFNNKGNPVREFEPFFTDTHRFEFDTRIGVSSILFYDPPGRVVATLHPNHTWEKVVFDAWKQATWDVNDTVMDDPASDSDIGQYLRDLPTSTYQPTWRAQRIGGALGPEEQTAATKADVHARTPTIAHFDPLGRIVLTLAHNRTKSNPADDQFYPTRVLLDIEGNQLHIRDSVGGVDGPEGRITMSYKYDMLGNRIYSKSIDAGSRWTLNDVAGNPIYRWDSRRHRIGTRYDRLRRPVATILRIDTGNETMVERTDYGDWEPDPESKNLRGQIYRQYDQAGVVINERFDFKGNLTSSTRQLARNYRDTLNWEVNNSLEADVYRSSTRFDALNRPVELTSPDASVVRPKYNEAGLLESVAARLVGDADDTDFVSNIDYNARGQRTQIAFGNGAATTYEYDRLTFRLIHLQTRRDSARFPGDCRNPAPTGWPGCGLQDLSYVYDPVGNITFIRDSAQQTIFFRNRKVDPSNQYTYDAVYRLIKATGREHMGQTGCPIIPDAFGAGHPALPHPGDGNAVGTYTECYLYDAVGNILQMKHCDPNNNGWTRDYAYAPSSNRLVNTRIGASVENYQHDANGNITAMQHLPLMRWNYLDQLAATSRSSSGRQPITYYVYDSAGQRVRKVTESPGGRRSDERIYVRSFEVYRKYAADGAATLERETLHIQDDQERIAIVERRTAGTEGEARLIRYQHSNHLGSAVIELDAEANVISYEEFLPFGSTSYRAARAGLNANAKRYRYTSKERDEENGFYYHGARYYAPWLGRWTACDPAGMARINNNVFEYVSNNPIRLRDPTGWEGQPPSMSKGFWDHVGDVASGVWLGGKEAVVGVKDLAVGAFNVSLVGMIVDREQWERSNETLGQTITAIADDPSVIWSAVKEPYVRAVNEGRPGEAIGRGVLEAVSIVVGAKGADKLAKGSKIGAAASKAEEAGASISKAGKLAEGERLVDDVSRIAKAVTARSADVPSVADAKLSNLVKDLYKGAEGPNRIGTGSTADAVRNELITGLPTHGRFHAQKAQEYSNALTTWLKKNPNASHYDRLVAQSLLDDLKAALRGQ